MYSFCLSKRGSTLILYYKTLIYYLLKSAFDMQVVFILLCLALYLAEIQAQIFCLGRPRSK